MQQAFFPGPTGGITDDGAKSREGGYPRDANRYGLNSRDP